MLPNVAASVVATEHSIPWSKWPSFGEGPLLLATASLLLGSWEKNTFPLQGHLVILLKIQLPWLSYSFAPVSIQSNQEAQRVPGKNRSRGRKSQFLFYGVRTNFPESFCKGPSNNFLSSSRSSGWDQWSGQWWLPWSTTMLSSPMQRPSLKDWQFSKVMNQRKTGRSVKFAGGNRWSCIPRKRYLEGWWRKSKPVPVVCERKGHSKPYFLESTFEPNVQSYKLKRNFAH